VSAARGLQWRRTAPRRLRQDSLPQGGRRHDDRRPQRRRGQRGSGRGDSGGHLSPGTVAPLLIQRTQGRFPAGGQGRLRGRPALQADLRYARVGAAGGGRGRHGPDEEQRARVHGLPDPVLPAHQAQRQDPIRLQRVWQDLWPAVEPQGEFFRSKTEDGD